jgi:DnaK suppressor protein
MIEVKNVEREKKYLWQEKTQVMSELAHLREAVQVEIDAAPDEADVEITNRETNIILIGILERRLHHLDAGLQAIQRGTYGVCMRCGQPIEVERLAVRPEAILRLACQQAVEASGQR